MVSIPVRQDAARRPPRSSWQRASLIATCSAGFRNRCTHATRSCAEPIEPASQAGITALRARETSGGGGSMKRLIEPAA